MVAPAPSKPADMARSPQQPEHQQRRAGDGAERADDAAFGRLCDRDEHLPADEQRQAGNADSDRRNLSAAGWGQGWVLVHARSMASDMQRVI